MKTTMVSWFTGAALLAAAGGCGSSSATGTGGGGAGTTSSSGTTTSTSTSTMGTGGGGGSAGGCLDPKTFASLFAIEDASLCAVATYDAAESFATSYMTAIPLSWGSHGGPLSLRPSTTTAGGVELVRWKVPAGTQGTLTSTVTTVDAKLPDLTSSMPAAFLSFPAIDLPFFGLTAVAYTGMSQDGEILLVNGSSVAVRYPSTGTYAMAAVAKDATHGRLLFTGENAPGGTVASGMSGTNALYAADACGTAAMPEIANTTDPACAPVTVAAWGNYSGPMVVDGAGNAIAVMAGGTMMAPTNDARAFAASSVAPGAPPATATQLFATPGTADSLAALAPTATADGIVAFQGLDSSFLPEDVIAQHYTASSGTIAPKGMPATLLKLATMGTPVVLFTDDQPRLWVGVPDSGGTKTTFVVIARAQ